MTPPDALNFEEHWSVSVETYRAHPTSRHRQRFVMKSLRRLAPGPTAFVFDYGCGAGIMLENAARALGLRADQLGGCDVSPQAVEQTRTRVDSPHIYCDAFPPLDRRCDAILCSEVIEHTLNHRAILSWTWDHLVPGGFLILTTASGTLDPPDAYYGHVHHFRLEELRSDLEDLGFLVPYAACWGFPFFTLQKWVTKRMFARVRTGFMEGSLSLKKRVIFGIAYYAYAVHALIPFGPQLFVIAQRHE